MRMRSAFLIGSLMLIATTGCVAHIPDRFTETVQGVGTIERIGHGGSTYSPYTLDGTVDCRLTAAEVASMADAERIGHGGSLYSFTRLTPSETGDCNEKTQRVIADERIGHGGSMYTSGETTTN